MTYAFKQSLKMKPLIAALLLASVNAHTHAAGPEVTPDSGSLLQQLRPALPVLPSSNTPQIQVQPKADTALPPSKPLKVNSIRITGNTAFATETLHALIADQEGKNLTLPQLEELAGRITAYYQSHGYPLARAIIPAQSISDGIVVIQVVEARYGKVKLNNQSRVNDALLNATLASLGNGQLIVDDELNRALLLLSDVPGVGVSTILKPGAEVGSSDVDVDAFNSKTTFANLSVDNYGSRYIGRERLSGSFNLINPFNHGDILSANIVSTGNGMNYGRVAYDTLLNGQGTRVGVAYSLLRYKLGDSIRALDANGTASVASLWVKQPLLRSKQSNVYAQLQYDAKDLRDRIDTSNTRTDRHLNNWVLSVNGDHRDNVLTGGVSVASLAWTAGRTGFDDASAAAADAATARTSGSFSKWNANFTRLQGLTARSSLYANITAQWVDSNLDSAEKMTAGGPYSVRAYDIGAISGDTGYIGTVELRHDLGAMLGGQWQASAFVDSAHVKVNHSPWSNGQNSATLSGAGLGLNWSGPDLWRISTSVATRIGSTPSLLAKPSSVRAWLVVSKGF